jgi:hypothetical protein
VKRAVRSSLIAACLLPTIACSKSGPDVAEMKKEVDAKEAKLKQEREEALAKEKAALDALLPQVAEKRKPLDASFGTVWANLPTDTRNMKRTECPDAKITADTPDESKRAILMLNKESVYVLTGRAKPAGDGGVEEIHTPAAFHAFHLVRPQGKETPLLSAGPPRSSEQARAQLAAIDFIMAHRYLGVALLTVYREADAMAARPVPTRIEGWTVVVDRETGKPLCQVESNGESIAQKENVSTGDLADEEAWGLYVHTSAKNLEAISKVLTVEGAPRKKR